ncbi:MAG: NAD(P)-dependent oxidoreductase [Acidimicrobiales bacterium]
MTEILERSAGATPARIAVLPEGGFAKQVAAALSGVGLDVTTDPKTADALVWCATGPSGMAAVLEQAPGVRWVQLPYAGVERFSRLIDDQRSWTCAKDIYGPAVAEFALGLLIAGMRRIDRYAVAADWKPLPESTLARSKVAILGAGGIGRSLTGMLLPLGAEVTVVSRSGRAVPGALAVAQDRTQEVLGSADAVVLALPLTPATAAMVDATFLESMKPTAWLVNVARGQIVVTDDLVRSLEAGQIAGAALDVTDPEPLPAGHRLWELENALITPHVANTGALGARELVALVRENGLRFAAGQPLEGLVDPHLGY